MNADQRGSDQRHQRQVERLQVITAADGDQAEKQPDENFAERSVGDRRRAAGIGPTGGERGKADQDNRPAAVPDKVNAAQEGEGKGLPGAGFDPVDAEPAFGGGTFGAKAVRGVGAAQEVADIIE